MKSSLIVLALLLSSKLLFSQNQFNQPISIPLIIPNIPTQSSPNQVQPSSNWQQQGYGYYGYQYNEQDAQRAEMESYSDSLNRLSFTKLTNTIDSLLNENLELHQIILNDKIQLAKNSKEIMRLKKQK